MELTGPVVHREQLGYVIGNVRGLPVREYFADRQPVDEAGYPLVDYRESNRKPKRSPSQLPLPEGRGLRKPNQMN